MTNPFLRRAGDNAHGRKAEKLAMKEHKATLHAGSGAIDGLKSDGSTKYLRFESKATLAKSFSVTLATLEKIRKEALCHGQEPVLTVAFCHENGRTKPNGDFVVISRSFFNELTDTYEGSK